MKELNNDYTVVSGDVPDEFDPALVDEIKEFQKDFESYIRRTNDLESARDRTLQDVEQEDELIARIVGKLGITDEVYELRRLRDAQTKRFRDLAVPPSAGAKE